MKTENTEWAVKKLKMSQIYFKEILKYRKTSKPISMKFALNFDIIDDENQRVHVKCFSILNQNWNIWYSEEWHCLGENWNELIDKNKDTKIM